ncbi:mechanosensitive ion channel family protein [Weissella viridescens]|uniref:Mechanosensitive ion channel family protein n=1 Tax=Weissella viridescens TaxID=1629 RepID=A0A3P2R9R4_WEIVI|nr:mechanosensitive ion channel domain-containing protein [Weissella viridescens]RRG17549.1 mechanosensitive ion channel family protein [Weissella viridescens]
MKTKNILYWIEETFDWQNLAITVASLIVMGLVGHYGVRYVMNKLSHHKFKHFPKSAPLVIRALAGPITVIVYTVGINLLFEYLHAPHSLVLIANQVLRTWILISFGVILYRLIPMLMATVTMVGRHKKFEVSEIMRSFLTTILQILMVVVIIFAILETWQININGLFAGVGLTGLAVSMAAQDQIKNFLGGAVIIGEKSFSIGDKIESPSIHGTVEDITFRSTKLRTSTGALQVVPNSTLANEPITNDSRMDVPRITLDYYLDVDTSDEQVSQLRQRILDFLSQDDRFMAKHMEYQVKIPEIVNQGIHIQVNGPLSPSGKADHGDEAKAILNLNVLKSAKALDIKFAKADPLEAGG